MPWNQPGGSGDKDPWGQRGDNQTPPDLDEIVRKVQQRLGGLFGGGRGRGGAGGGLGDAAGKYGIILFLLVVVAIWLLSGIYIVKQGEESVVLRFGKYLETTGAGLHWRFPYPFESNQIVNVDKVNTVEVGYRSSDRGTERTPVTREALMLTQDANIVDIEFTVQYRIKDPKDLLFNISDQPSSLVRSATEASLREVLGKSTLDFIITTGRAQVVDQTKAQLQEILDRYHSGIQVVTAQMLSAAAPAEVQPAFEDVIKAKEDEDRLKNEAEAYTNDIVPQARGRAARIIQDAQAYKAQVVAQAQGETKRFLQILTQYKKAPSVTRERLYIDAVQSMLEHTSKVLIDQKGGNNMFYLPLDKIIEKSRAQAQSAAGTDAATTTTSTPPAGNNSDNSGRDDSRSARGQ